MKFLTRGAGILVLAIVVLTILVGETSLGDVSLGGNVMSDTRFDWTVGKMSTMQGEQVLEGRPLENLKAQSQFMRELKYKELGYTLLLESVEMVEGRETYRVEVTHPGSGTGYDYYDAETGLRVREDKIEVTPDGEMIQTTHLSDYKDVDGILYPHQLDLSIGPQQISATIDSIRLNTGIDDAEFR